jgi:hypothetical protein
MEMIESGKYVNDVDECLNGAHNCAPQALCMNTPGLLFVIDNEAFCCRHAYLGKRGQTENLELTDYVCTVDARVRCIEKNVPTLNCKSLCLMRRLFAEIPQKLYLLIACCCSVGSFQCTCQLGYEGPGEFCHACNDPDTMFAHMNLYQQVIFPHCTLFNRVFVGCFHGVFKFSVHYLCSPIFCPVKQPHIHYTIFVCQLTRVFGVDSINVLFIFRSILVSVSAMDMLKRSPHPSGFSFSSLCAHKFA